MSQYKYAEIADTVYFWFAANDTDGDAGDGATPLYDVRLAGAASDAAATASGTPTLLSSANYAAGIHEIAIDTTGYAAGEYAVFCTLTISTVNPSGFCGSFKLRTAGTAAIDTNTVSIANGGITAVSIAASALDDKGNWNTTTPNVVVPDAAGTASTLLGVNGASLTAINLPNQTMDIVGNITGNLSGSVGTLTGDVTLADSAITAAKIAASALDDKGNWNIGKTGYSLSTAGILAIWHQLTAAVVTASTMGKLVIDYLNAAVSSRSSHDAAGVKTAIEIGGSSIAQILADTSTTIPGTITTAQNDLDLLTGADGATLATTQPNYSAGGATAEEVRIEMEGSGNVLDQILTDTGTTIPDTITTAQTAITFIENVLEGDVTIDTTTTPWQMVVKTKGTATELIRKNLKDKDGANITSTTTVIAQKTEPA